MKKLFLIAAIVAMVSCTGQTNVPVQEETDSIESVADTLLTDSLVIDTLSVDTI